MHRTIAALALTAALTGCSTSNDAKVVDSTTTTAANGAAAAAGESTTTAKASGTGSMTAPLPIGTEIDLANGWHVKVNSPAIVGAEATAAVTAANQFNQPPKAGMGFAIVNLTLSFAGTKDTQTQPVMMGVQTAVFGSGKVERQSTYGVTPEPAIDTSAELAAGGSVTGNLLFEVGEGETGLALRVQPSMSMDNTEAWLALS